MIVFDIGANRGEATAAALELGADTVLALEPAPKMFIKLAHTYATDKRVIPLKLVASAKDNKYIEFYECVEDGLSTMDLNWIQGEKAPYGDKAYKTIKAHTVTIDMLSGVYGTPDLIKVDVEGAELSVLEGMTKKMGTVTFEWQLKWEDQVPKCLEHLLWLGYTEFSPQYIVEHLKEPTRWYGIETYSFKQWHKDTRDAWENGLWKEANLRPTADAGMIWVK